MDRILIIYLPVFVLIYLLLCFVLPSWRVYRQTGINPVTFGKTDSAHDYIGRLMKILTALLVATVLIFSLFPNVYRWLVPITYLEQQPIRYLGLVLAHLSLAWILIAQLQMKNSWRIGIDETHKTGLVTAGLFSISRNPIFLGMICSVTGLFLILPNLLSFFVAAATYMIIQIQIRLEEVFLEKQHGIVYNEYKKQVRRLL